MDDIEVLKAVKLSRRTSVAAPLRRRSWSLPDGGRVAGDGWSLSRSLKHVSGLATDRFGRRTAMSLDPFEARENKD